MFLLVALFGVHFADELHSSFYEWENKKVVEKINDLKKYQRFDDDGPHVCRVKAQSETSWAKDEIHLIGEVFNGWCVYGWNDVQKAKDYEFLKPNCDSGSALSWQTEEVNLEYGTETMVRSDQGEDKEVDFIGICRYNGKYGWKYGRSCQWKRPSMGAQKNEFGERHEVLTTIGCEVKSEKPRARNLFRFLQSRPISNELYINFPPHEEGKTFNMNENYSVKFRGRQHKQTNSTIKFSTGLIRLEEDEAVETTFRFIPNGQNVKNRHFTFILMFFEKRDDTGSLVLKKMVNFKPELNLESITPKNFEFTHPRVSPFVSLEITQILTPDGTQANIPHSKILNLRLKAVNVHDTWACDNPDSKTNHEIKEDMPETKPEVKSEPEVEASSGCHVMGPYKKGKFICNPLTKRCSVACRRKYNSVYNEYNELKCLNGKWLTYRSSELVDAETLYANLNYICRHAENAQRPNRPYMPGRELP